MRVAAVALLVLVAGCLGDADTPAAEPEPDAPDAPAPRAPAPADPLANATPPPPVLYLTAAGGLSPAPGGEETRIPSPVGTQGFLTGPGAALSWSGAALPTAWVATSVRLVLLVASEGASVSHSPGAGGLPEIFTWLSSGEAVMGGNGVQGPDSIAPDARAEVVAELELPAGGLVLRPGAPLGFMVIPTYPQTEAANRVVVLVGGEAGSRLEIEATLAVLPDTTPVAVTPLAGKVQGDACSSPPQEGLSIATFPLEVPEEAVGLVLDLASTPGPGLYTDLDLVAFGPTGEVAARAHSPRGAERIELWAPNLDAAGRGAWTVRVVSCTVGGGDFVVTPTVHLRGVQTPGTANALSV